MNALDILPTYKPSPAARRRAFGSGTTIILVIATLVVAAFLAANLLARITTPLGGARMSAEARGLSPVGKAGGRGGVLLEYQIVF